MTSVSRSEKEWLVVLSQGTGITRQMVWRQEWSQLAPWIAENTNKGYCITDLAFDGQAWTVVMSENSKYSSQGYLWANSTQELMELVQREVWGKGFNIHQVEYGAGKYLVVYGTASRTCRSAPMKSRSISASSGPRASASPTSEADCPT